MKTPRPSLALSLACLLALPMYGYADNEVGFIERFALAEDRAKVLTELVPGTDEFYFYHALHYQNTRNAAALADTMKQWKERFPDETQNRRVILNREALLSYDADPQATLAYLRDQLHIEHDHQQIVRDKKPDLPSALDASRVAREVFLKDALRADSGLQTLSQEALVALVETRAALSMHQRRGLLEKLQRPDVQGLVEFIAQELRSEESRGFGEFAVHRQLLPSQLDELAKLMPELEQQEAFVFTKMHKLAPSADVNLEQDKAEREAWLNRVWDYAKTLPPSFTSLKAQALLLRLEHDRRLGIYDRERFMAYIALPRNVGYMAEGYVERTAGQGIATADLDADCGDALLGNEGLPQEDEQELVRDYLLHFFAEAPVEDEAAALAPFAQYLSDVWLRPLLAEAMITIGQGNRERWASLLPPSDYQALKERVDIEFPPTNPELLQPGDEVRFDVIVKNTPKLLVKLYELNTLNFFLSQKRQLNTDLNLDGLIANAEQTRSFDSGPFKRERVSFAFDELKGKRGAWIIEFIGGGRSSRALIRVGQWQMLQQSGPSGDMLLVLDEKGEPVKDAVAWFDGRKFTPDEKLQRLIIPYTTSTPGSREIVLADAAGSFATLARFEHHAEHYTLDAQFHIEREQLLARREAALAVRVSLRLGETQLDPALLLEPQLTITSTSLDGIATTTEVKGLKLVGDKLLTHQLKVPERLAKLDVRLSAKVEKLSAGGEPLSLQAARQWSINGIDATVSVNDGHLSIFDGVKVFELLGKNGEPVPDQPVTFKFKHRDFARQQTITLSSDERGRIVLGKLPGIQSITAECPNGRRSTWPLNESARTWPETIHWLSGSNILPVLMGQTQPVLLAVAAETFVADHSAQVTRTEDGFIGIKDLAPGDYSLRVPATESSEAQDIILKVTAGKTLAGWHLGKHRQLQALDQRSIAIAKIDTASSPDSIVIQLANASPFSRVHVAATRFEPGQGLFGSLASFTRFSPAESTPDYLPNLFSAGREIGDEYRYILERKAAKRFPGNRLTRPGLLLNPWSVMDTDVEALSNDAGASAGATTGGAVGSAKRAKAMAAPKPAEGASSPGGTNLDFLANAAPVLYNLVPDKDGIVRIERKALGDRQHLQIYAEDLSSADWQSLSLPEKPVALADQRLARHLDPAKAFTQKRETTLLAPGQSLTLEDILTSELETYDTLSSVYALFTTLSHDADLAKFSWLMRWPKLSEEEKRAKYSEFACHELSFFLARKDKPFFDAVIRPYLANKKALTFIDHFLLGHDLKAYLEPWAYAQLNAAERCLLAQRLEGEAPANARRLRELIDMKPLPLEYADSLFETALGGRAMEGARGDLDDFDKMKQVAAEADGEAMPRAMRFGTAGGTVVPETLGGFGNGRAMGGAFATNPLAAVDAFAGAPMSVPAAAPMPPPPPASVAMMDAPEARPGLVKSGDGRRSLTDGGALSYTNVAATGATYGELGYIGKKTAEAARRQARAFYRALGPTKQWAENNYWHTTADITTPVIIPNNAFWRDYAAWIAAGSKEAFLSPHLAEAQGFFASMMFALAVLDLPFEVTAKPTIKTEGQRFTFTAGSPVIVFHKEIKPAPAADAQQGQLLVSQSFYRADDRYRQEGSEKREKYVTGEFLTGVLYGATVVVTNPTSAPTKATVLLQLPQGSLPASSYKMTDSRHLRLEPYTTKTFEYAFYFPAVAGQAGAKFPHFPASVAVASGVAGNAKPFAFNVVARLTEVDTASWEHVSQYGSDAEVMTFLAEHNLEALDLTKIAWRCRERVEFYRALMTLLKQQHVWNETLASYALKHNDPATLGEWLKHQQGFVQACGPWLESSLVTFDAVERRSYEHFEFSPLVNQRAHRLGNEWRIANPVLVQQYRALMDILAHKPKLSADDELAVVYYLFLQDRIEEALDRLHALKTDALPYQLQLDYLRCYAALYEEQPEQALAIAAKYQNHPVPKWRERFAEVRGMGVPPVTGGTGILPVTSAEGVSPDKVNTPASGKMPEAPVTGGTPVPLSTGKMPVPPSQANASLAETEPSFDFKVENKSIALTWRNLREVTVNYYLMDPEFSFSSSPFVSQDASRFSIIKPSRSARQALPEGKDSLDIALPADYAKANVLVEIVGAGQRKAQAYHANTLKLTLTETYGLLEARDSISGKPVSKAYVKVYARVAGGAVKFFKDGYTDLQGRFDYASLNGPQQPGTIQPSFEPPPANGLDYPMLKPNEQAATERLAILVLSDSNGATVKEVAPPAK